MRATKTLVLSAAVLTAMVVIGACATGDPSADDAGADAQTARERFASYCAGCHGTDGDGQGPDSGDLLWPPPDFTDPAWQRATTDDHIYLVISQGSAAAGMSAVMPPSPYADRPDVIRALVQIVRGFGSREPGGGSAPRPDERPRRLP